LDVTLLGARGVQRRDRDGGSARCGDPLNGGRGPGEEDLPALRPGSGGGESRERAAGGVRDTDGSAAFDLDFRQFRASRAQGDGEERQPLTVRGEERRAPILRAWDEPLFQLVERAEEEPALAVLRTSKHDPGSVRADHHARSLLQQIVAKGQRNGEVDRPGSRRAVNAADRESSGQDAQQGQGRSTCEPSR
jgi:hypothetical protein